MARKRYAEVVGTVGSSGLTSSATSHTFTAPLTFANGSTVPTLVSPDYFLLSILDAGGALSEVVRVTAYNQSTGAATLRRGQESTAGVSHTSGDQVTMAAYVSDFPALPTVDLIYDYSAAIDGTTDDNTPFQNALNEIGNAGGGKVTAHRGGRLIIGGSVQDTSHANAQLLLPSLDYGDDEQISVTIEGPIPPPSIVSVVGATPLPNNHLVIESPLTTSGAALLGGQGPTGTSESFTNLDLTLRNLTWRMPANPVPLGLNLLKVAAVDLDRVIVDAGSYDVAAATLPSTSTSYGIKLPDINNGAHVSLRHVDVIGFYNGMLVNEHTFGQYVALWGCTRALVFAAANHPSLFVRLGIYHCPRGLVFTGAHKTRILQLAIEHAASGSYAPTYDIDDASNNGLGDLQYAVVKAGVGPDTTFLRNSGAGIITTPIGSAQTPAVYKGRDRMVASAGNNVLTLGATPVAGSPVVWVNNTIKWPGTDYTISGAVISFNSALSASDVVEVLYDTLTASPGASALSTAIYVADNFNRADSASSLGSTSTGSVAWTAAVDTWGIASNQAYKASGTSTGIAVVESGHGDCTITATLVTAISTSNTGIAFRYQDSGNHWVLEGGNGSTQAALYKKTGGGSYTSVATSAGNVHFTNGDIIQVILSGSSITVKQNGTTIITASDSAFSTATKHGLHISGNDNTARFDDFSVTP